MEDDSLHAGITYNDRLERLIADEGERLQGLAWLHEKSNNYYCKLNTLLALPIIVLSTLSGTISASSTTLFFDQKSASVCIGGVSIFVGILSTVQSYFGFARRAENHRLSGISCIKLNHFITIEMALPRKERVQAQDLLKIVRENIARLLETAPPIPSHIVAKFQERFVKQYPNVAVPDVANGLRAIVLAPVLTSPFSPDRSRSNTEARTPNLTLPPSPKQGQFLDVAGVVEHP
jgi:hypothetical protein